VHRKESYFGIGIRGYVASVACGLCFYKGNEADRVPSLVAGKGGRVGQGSEACLVHVAHMYHQ
jgi:hypothetical protein